MRMHSLVEIHNSVSLILDASVLGGRFSDDYSDNFTLLRQIIEFEKLSKTTMTVQIFCFQFYAAILRHDRRRPWVDFIKVGHKVQI